MPSFLIYFFASRPSFLLLFPSFSSSRPKPFLNFKVFHYSLDIKYVRAVYNDSGCFSNDWLLHWDMIYNFSRINFRAGSGGFWLRHSLPSGTCSQSRTPSRPNEERASGSLAACCSKCCSFSAARRSKMSCSLQSLNPRIRQRDTSWGCKPLWRPGKSARCRRCTLQLSPRSSSCQGGGLRGWLEAELRCTFRRPDHSCPCRNSSSWPGGWRCCRLRRCCSRTPGSTAGGCTGELAGLAVDEYWLGCQQIFHSQGKEDKVEKYR